MKWAFVTVCVLMPSSAMAQQFPELSDPVLKTMVARYIAEQPEIQADTFLQHPAQSIMAPCLPTEVEQYRIAGLFSFHPELKAEADALARETRKSLRAAGADPDLAPQTKDSNPKLTVIEAHCKNGKLDGDYKFILSYDSTSTLNQSIPLGDKVVNGQTVTTMHFDRRTHNKYVEGVKQSDVAIYQIYSSHTETHYDDANMERVARKSNEMAAKIEPKMSVIYTGQDGYMASFTPTVEFKVGGILPHVKTSATLVSYFNRPVDAHHSISESYMGGQPVSISTSRDSKLHGEMITYMENIYRKMHVRLDQMPGMENAREVTINGRDLIEIRICYQNGMQVKISPCPSE